ncbi:hypothetical protein H2201_008307 [Coniosporium apollinis]|uniref:Calcineurin-like phosphoesterase domain-containing protein n=2 Tax=Coniosporium TaxID=2810619 RepID=A0ABQ9NLS0_9PEZI|nr:hypothetical protein H2199_007431 [Cladosporium sp. JES 115]KAJ9657099.1 hypothetical protein H2201_008307 [Coniosporium apollinis]
MSRPQYRKIRIVCISDTHNQTPKLPKGDVLIHAGDLTNHGSITELRKVVAWLEKADFQAKIVVAGNHDITLDPDFYREHGAYTHPQNVQDPEECLRLLTESLTITYLNHESATVRLTSVDGSYTQLRVFGSPWSPKLPTGHGKWAFQYEGEKVTKVWEAIPEHRSEQAVKLWDAIPLDTDIVVTHTPPKNHCDSTYVSSGRAGCEALRRALWRVRPKVAICGHMHEGRGVKRIRWSLNMPQVRYMEESTEIWTDPGLGNNKQSLVDLTARSGKPLDSHDGPLEQRAPSNRVSFSPSSPEQSTPIPDDPAALVKADPDAHHVRAHLHRRQKHRTLRGLAERSAAEKGWTELDEALSRLDDHDAAALNGRMGRRETCVVNAAIKARSWGTVGTKLLNKPIIVDIDLPVWPAT